MEKKIFIKIYKSFRIVVAVCDADLLGKKFEEGRKQLDIKDSFYKGEEFNAERAIEIMKRQQKEDATFNIAGNFSVKKALEAGIIEEDNIGEVDGIKFALALL